MYKQDAGSRELFLRHPRIFPMLLKSVVIYFLELAFNIGVHTIPLQRLIGVFVKCSQMLKGKHKTIKFVIIN